MSVWKKASKANQKTHRERHQPEERQHLGLLEKKKDYVRRAQDFNEKKETLKILHKRALNKNPDEFYHHMINSKVENGKHFDKETQDEDTPDQVRLMRSQDLKYIVTKKTQEQKKIERLQAQLHLSSVDHEVKNKHIFFGKNIDKEEFQKRKIDELKVKAIPDVNLKQLEASTNAKKQLYGQLGKRINRERELSLIQHKIEMKRHIANKKTILKPKKLRSASQTEAPVYLWKYERKR